MEHVIISGAFHSATYLNHVLDLFQLLHHEFYDLLGGEDLVLVFVVPLIGTGSRGSGFLPY